MKYYITHYMNEENKKTLRKFGLYCYDLRSISPKGEIATIENRATINNCGSIITDKKINFEETPFVDYKDFCENNIKAKNIKDLIVSKVFITDIILDQYIVLKKDFDFLGIDEKEYGKLISSPIEEQDKHILGIFKDNEKYDLMSISKYGYKLYFYDYSRTLENVLDKDKEKTNNNIER